MYVLRRRYDHNRRWLSDMLIEMTAKEFKAVADNENPVYFKVGSDKARRMVKEGHIHETGLYINCEGKVRYAKDDSWGVC